MEGNVVAGILIPFAGTALGAACVFFMRRGMGAALRRGLNGLAAGIMAAASFFSLLLPALERGGILPVLAGFLPGMLFLWLADALLPRVQQAERRLTATEKMLLAVTLHNLPEGMAVGAAYAGWLFGGGEAALAGAFSLALGIALQNIPEGAIVSMPLRAEGMGRGRAFFYGAMSGAVEPVGALLILAAIGIFLPLLPALMAFAAGAMFSVIVEELIPDRMQEEMKSPVSLWFSLGFALMMTLDATLG